MKNDMTVNRCFLETEDEEEACRLLFDTYYKKTFDIAHKMLRCFPYIAIDADDITAETFTKAFTHRKNIRNPANLAGWLITVARNLIVDKVRRMETETQGCSIERLSGQESEVHFASHCAETDSRAAEESLYRLERAVRLLRGPDREIIESKRDGLPMAEIAKNLALTHNAAQKRWERLLAWLQPVAIHLDDLVDALPAATDRKIMERYLDNQPVSEIGKSVGTSDDCVARQIEVIIACWKRAGQRNPDDPVSTMLHIFAEKKRYKRC